MALFEAIEREQARRGDQLCRQRRGKLVLRSGRVSRQRSPMGKLVPDGQGLGVLGPADPLADGQQRGELVSRGSRVPGAPSPVGKLLTRG